MKKHYPYLKDDYFLTKLYGQYNKTTYVAINVLDWEERFIERVEGKVVNASININGDSSVRRTANLTVKITDASENYNNINSLFSINKKIYLETGLKNNLRHFGKKFYSEYETIWFPLGTYVIINYSLTHDISGLSISLTLNDKMCLLNGECGGTLPASVVFDQYDTIDENGN